MKFKKPSFDEVKSSLKNFAGEASNRTSSAWAWGAALASEASINISQIDAWKAINEFTSEVSKAMDRTFLDVLNNKASIMDLDTGLKFMPNNHRILDEGHTLFSSIERAREIGDQNGWTGSETFLEWAKAYSSDFSSAAGMPVFGKYSDEIYAFLCERLNLSEDVARNIVTVNGQEALQTIFAGTVSAVGFYYAWKKQDQEAFSKIAGSVLFTGAVTLNPVLIAFAVVSMSIGFQTLVEPKAVARGAFITGSTFIVSAVIPGPAMLGLIPAMVVGYYLNKKLDRDFELMSFIKDNYSYIRFDEFQQKFEEFMNSTTEVFSSATKKTGT